MEHNEWEIVKEAKDDIAADVIYLSTREAQSKVQLTVSEITGKQFQLGSTSRSNYLNFVHWTSRSIAVN